MFNFGKKKDSSLMAQCKRVFEQGGAKALEKFINSLTAEERNQLQKDYAMRILEEFEQEIMAVIQKGFEDSIVLKGFSAN